MEDGVQALDYLLGRGAYAGRDPVRRPKVMLLDVKLPKMSGFEVLQAVRGEENLKSMPVVMVTSSHEDPDIRRAYECGANSYVVKPVELDAFLEAMSSIGLYWLLLNQPPR